MPARTPAPRRPACEEWSDRERHRPIVVADVAAEYPLVAAIVVQVRAAAADGKSD
jgi:hypothetical protein